MPSAGQVVEHREGVADLAALPRDRIGDLFARGSVVQRQSADSVPRPRLAEKRSVRPETENVIRIHRIGFDKDFLPPAERIRVEIFLVP